MKVRYLSNLEPVGFTVATRNKSDIAFLGVTAKSSIGTRCAR